MRVSSGALSGHYYALGKFTPTMTSPVCTVLLSRKCVFFLVAQNVVMNFVKYQMLKTYRTSVTKQEPFLFTSRS